MPPCEEIFLKFWLRNGAFWSTEKCCILHFFRFLIFHPFSHGGQLTPFAPMCGRPWEGVWYLRFVACSWNCGMSSGLHLLCSDYLPGVQQAVGWPLSLGSRRSPLRRNATLLNAAAAAVFIGDRITHVSQTCSAALRSSPDTHSHDSLHIRARHTYRLTFVEILTRTRWIVAYRNRERIWFTDHFIVVNQYVCESCVWQLL